MVPVTQASKIRTSAHSEIDKVKLKEIGKASGDQGLPGNEGGGLIGVVIVIRKLLDDVIGDLLVEVTQDLDQRPGDVRRRERLVQRHHIVRVRDRSLLLRAPACIPAAASTAVSGTRVAAAAARAGQTKALTRSPGVDAPAQPDCDICRQAAAEVIGRGRPRGQEAGSASVQGHRGAGLPLRRNAVGGGQVESKLRLVALVIDGCAT